MKNKKINIKFYLNRNLKPVEAPQYPGHKSYPLYINVTYNRKNTQIKSMCNRYFPDLSEAFKSKESINRTSEESLLRRVIEYETKSQGDKFSLRNLSIRYLDYSDSIINVINKYFADQIYNAILKSDSEFDLMLKLSKDYNLPFELYYKATRKLIEGIDRKLPQDFQDELQIGIDFRKWVDNRRLDVSQIDWLDYTAINDYIIYLENKNIPEKEIKDSIRHISRILRIITGLVVS